MAKMLKIVSARPRSLTMSKNNAGAKRKMFIWGEGVGEGEWGWVMVNEGEWGWVRWSEGECGCHQQNMHKQK